MKGRLAFSVMAFSHKEDGRGSLFAKLLRSSLLGLARP